MKLRKNVKHVQINVKGVHQKQIVKCAKQVTGLLIHKHAHLHVKHKSAKLDPMVVLSADQFKVKMNVKLVKSVGYITDFQMNACK